MVHVIYIVKLLVLYVVGGLFVATATSGLGPFWDLAAWWPEPIVYEKPGAGDVKANRGGGKPCRRSSHLMMVAASCVENPAIEDTMLRIGFDGVGGSWLNAARSSTLSWGVEELVDELRPCLDVVEVVCDSQCCIGQVVGQCLGRFEGVTGVVGPGEHEGGLGERCESGRRWEVGCCSTSEDGSEDVGVHPRQSVESVGADLFAGRPEHDRRVLVLCDVDEGAHAACQDEFCAAFVDLALCDAGAPGGWRCREDEAVDPVGCSQRRVDGGGAPHGCSADGAALHAESVEDGDDVGTELRPRVGGRVVRTMR